MSIRQFSGRIFFNDRAINLKIGGPVSDDGCMRPLQIDCPALYVLGLHTLQKCENVIYGIEILPY
jgi:hypothetical protein